MQDVLRYMLYEIVTKFSFVIFDIGSGIVEETLVPYFSKMISTSFCNKIQNVYATDVFHAEFFLSEFLLDSK